LTLCVISDTLLDPFINAGCLLKDNTMGTKQTSIGIVGVGAVGERLAFELVRHCPETQLLLYNKPEKKAIKKGLKVATELRELASFEGSVGGRAVFTVDDLDLMRAKCDIIIICIKSDYSYKTQLARAKKRAQKGAEPELREVAIERDAPEIARLADKFRGFKGLFIIVTNPVEFMVMLFRRFSGCATNRIIGFGLSLDALRAPIGTKEIHPRCEINVVTFGTHGAHAFISETRSALDGVQVSKFKNMLNDAELALKRGNQDAVQRALDYNGTVYGPAYVLAMDVNRLLNGGIMNASGYQPLLPERLASLPLGGLFSFQNGMFCPQRLEFNESEESRQRRAGKHLRKLISTHRTLFGN
jgi:malate/lactate dehydrogenase